MRPIPLARRAGRFEQGRSGSEEMEIASLKLSLARAVPRVPIVPTFALLYALALSGCVWPPPDKSCPRPYYEASAIAHVAPGESLDTIAFKYGTTPAEIARYNKLAPNACLRPGTTLKIPPQKITAEARKSSIWNPVESAKNFGGAAVQFGKGTTQKVCEVVPKCARGAAGIVARGSRAAESGRVPASFVSYNVNARITDVSNSGYSWPVVGKVSRPFDECTNHRGLDILAPEGTPVFASRSGKVIYSDNKLAGFGNLVIIDHGGGIASIYAHNRRNLVRVGDSVRGGQRIAEVGHTGNATADHCHFEVRQQAKAINPKPLLPNWGTTGSSVQSSNVQSLKSGARPVLPPSKKG